MLNRRWRVLALIAAGLLAMGPPGAGGEEAVKGRGFAAFQRPSDAADPPPAWTHDEFAHDVDEGETFDLTDHYELSQGPVEDNRERWKSTNYIRWAVNGATLEATGQITDGDNRQPTIATSEAWGAQYVEAKVSDAEGDFGSIRAENRIAATYSYLISGRYVAEASVQLNSIAFDLKHRDHTFHLSDTTGESVDTEESGSSDSDLRTRIAGSSTAALSTGQSGVSVKKEGEVTMTTSEQTDTRVRRRFRQANGGNGSSATAFLTASVEGVTPLEAEWQVFSEADVMLRARAGTVPGTGASSSVLLKLREFKVANTLRVWKTATWSRPPPGDEPPDIEPETPEGQPGPVPPGGGGGGATEGDARDAEADEREEEARHGREEDRSIGRLPLGPAGSARAVAVLVRPHGLAGEGGNLAGRVRVVLDQPAERDLRFNVDVDRPDLLESAVPELQIAAGARHGGVFVHGRAPGVAGVTLRLLDETGEPTDATLSLATELRSTADEPEPRLWIAMPGKGRVLAGAASARGLAGTTLGDLRIGRLGFDRFAETGTTVAIEVADPTGILAALPPAVTIPADAEEVRVPLALRMATGDAVITLRYGEQVRTVHVRSVAQAWHALDRVRVPAGATVAVPLFLAQPERSDRTVAAASDARSIAVAARADTLRPGERLGRVTVAGIAPGNTSVRVRSAGLADVSVPVEVVPSFLEVTDGRLIIRGLDAARAGRIVLWAPAGHVIAALAAPSESAEYLEVDGVGTGQVVITVHASPDLPETLSLPIAFDGSGAAHVDYLSSVHGPADQALTSYRVEVR